MSSFKMSRDIFCRGTRMTHRFGDLVDSRDPIGSTQAFTYTPPVRPDALSQMAPGRPFEARTDGQYGYRPESSPIQKMNGEYASIDGPKPDLAQQLGMPEPVGTKRRLGPLKTDK